MDTEDDATPGPTSEPLRFDDDSQLPADASVTVFWRPGCMFCSALFRELERTGLVFGRRDIWEDEEAAAFVRSVADGDETVPTVRVGDLALVNPSARDVLRAVADRDPGSLPETARNQLAQGPGRVGQFLGRLLGDGRE
ncbi:glutaredoxin domain-containing protein [Egicoccus sp. AB-alg6-2]|uniref:glutaredoxin domain-containing protein n=1 Tax=Egicoccus sp. AB-alg6-2 TaxID=3242692 RepID=UPI00359D1F9A